MTKGEGNKRKKRTREELWRRSVPGSDLSARGTCHARNAKREHRAAVIAEKSLSLSNLKFRGQREVNLWCHTVN